VPTRRKFIKNTSLGVAALAAPALVGCSKSITPTGPLLDYDAVGLAELVRTKQVTPKELVEATIRRIETYDDSINAVVTRAFDRALKAAEKVDLNTPFAGVPIVIKDNMDVAGVRTTHGSRFNKNDIASETAPLIKAYEDLGFVIVGKSNMPEHGAPPTTESKLFGPCHNPWSLEHSPGGSSGGSAAAVAMGYLPIAHANDGGGSNRIPASACNLFSLKPTRYRMIGELAGRPRTRFKSDHMISRTVRDNAWAFHLFQDVSAGAANPPLEKVIGPSKKRLKIGLTMKGMGNLKPDKDVRTRVEKTARRLEAEGHTIVPVDNPFNMEEFVYHYTTLFATRLADLAKLVEKTTGMPIEESGMLEGWTIGFAKEGATRKPGEKEVAEKALEKFARQTGAWIRPYDGVR